MPWLAPRPADWVIARWDGPPPFLNVTEDFAIVGARCRQPTHVHCMMRHSNTMSPHHFAHAIEGLLACWSLFNHFKPLVQRRVVLTGGMTFNQSPWTMAFLRLMQAEVVEGRVSAFVTEAILDVRSTLDWNSCVVRGELHQRMGSGWINDEMRWLASPEDAVALQQNLPIVGATRAFESNKASSWAARDLHRGYLPSLRIGFANRRAQRHLTNVAALRLALSNSTLSHHRSLSMEVLDDFGDVPFAEQASWVHRQDLLVLPHGAGCANLIFARPCTAVLEVYPNARYIPGEYLQLVRAVGGIGYTAYEGTYGYEEALKDPGCCADDPRTYNMTVDPTKLAQWAVEAERDQARCHSARRHGGTGLEHTGAGKKPAHNSRS